MEKFKKFTLTVGAVFSGMATGSLIATENDNWKIYLPIALLSITLNLKLNQK